MLTLRQINDLYVKLSQYIGDDFNFSEDDYVGFCTLLVRKILDGNNPDDYLDAVAIVSGLSPDDIVNHNAVEVFDIFLGALAESGFLEFVRLIRGLNG